MTFLNPCLFQYCWALIGDLGIFSKFFLLVFLDYLYQTRDTWVISYNSVTCACACIKIIFYPQNLTNDTMHRPI